MRNCCLVALAVVLIGSAVAEAQIQNNGNGSGGRRDGVGTRLRDRAGDLRSNFGNGPLGQDLREVNQQLQGDLKNGKLADKLNSLLGGGINSDNQTLKTNFKPGEEPFTPAWYAQHPNAWRYTHPHADAWAAATFGTAAAWLGINAATGANAATGGSVYTSDTGQGDEAAENEQAAGDLTGELRSGAVDGYQASGGGKFLPLGVYGLAPPNGQQAAAVVQLAVDEKGQLRGNYYDVLTGQDQQISGSVDKTTQQARFQVGTDGKQSYETTLWNLTQPAGPISLRLENGQIRQLTLARIEKPSDSQ